MVKKILIVTEPDDVHAILVKLASENLKHKVKLLFNADQPTRLKNSIYISDHGYYEYSVNNNRIAKKYDLYDVVWWRRPRKPFVPQDKLHPYDYNFANLENQLFYEGFTANLAAQAWWINPKISAGRANYKLLQLNVALACGLAIPPTLASNDPQEIYNFIYQFEEKGIIYKSFSPGCWSEQNRLILSYTAKLTCAELPGDEILQLVPGLYQQQMQKKYELRITCFGDYLVAVKIDSQKHCLGKLDWRAIPAAQLEVQPYKLPNFLELKIKKFMSQMGLVFGTLDFIVDTDGKYIFLEVNEQGQFLWIEECNKDIKMLDIFMQFVVSNSRKFKWQPKKIVHCIEDYCVEVQSILLHNTQNHVNLAKVY